MNSLFLVLGYNPNCLKRVYLYSCLSNQTKLVQEWERRKWTNNGTRGFLYLPHCTAPEDSYRGARCSHGFVWATKSFFLIPNSGVIGEAEMKLLTHHRLLLGRNFMNKHHRQWVKGKIGQICLTRELSNQLAIIAEGFSVAAESLGKKCLLLFHYFITAS